MGDINQVSPCLFSLKSTVFSQSTKIYGLAVAIKELELSSFGSYDCVHYAAEHLFTVTLD